jgi:hypothetical protein
LYRDGALLGRQPADEQVIKFQLQPELIQKFLQLYQKADFFNIEIDDLNKDRIRVTDVGTTTLSLSYAEKERSISYGYIEDNPFNELLRLYWQLLERYLPVK